MSSVNYENLISKFPADEELIGRLHDVLEGPNKKGAREFPVSRLYDLLKPQSEKTFAMLLSILMEQGVFERIIRVESPGLGGIGDYQSITDVPTLIHDFRHDVDIKVRPDDLKVIYKLRPSS